MKPKLFKLQVQTAMGWADVKLWVRPSWRPWLIVGMRQAYAERDALAVRQPGEVFRVVPETEAEDVDVYVEPGEDPAT